jgi:hypothetical protein
LTLTFQKEHQGAWGDVQWHTSSEDEVDDFWYSYTAGRDVTAQGNPVVGQEICKFGRTTGGTCDKVRQLNSCRGDICRLAMMENRKADGGDSGGPWFVGTVAYGIHSGYTTSSLKKRDQFTPNTYLDEALNVYLQTIG